MRFAEEGMVHCDPIQYNPIQSNTKAAPGEDRLIDKTMALRRLCSSGTYFLCSIEEECTKFIRSPVSADGDDAWATTTTTFVLHNRVMSDHNGRVPIRLKYLYTGTLCTNRPSDSHRLDSKGKRYSLDSEYIGQLAGLSGQVLPLSGKHKHQQ